MSLRRPSRMKSSRGALDTLPARRFCTCAFEQRSSLAVSSIVRTPRALPALGSGGTFKSQGSLGRKDTFRGSGSLNDDDTFFDDGSTRCLTLLR
jgi:hypothetical protein